jgi:hypothetical protein
VGSLSVVVADVLPHHPFEVSPAEDEHPVQALRPRGSHPALRIGVGARRSDRGLDHPDTLRAEYLVDAEPGVPVPDQDLDGSAAAGQATLLPPPAPLVFGRFPVPSEQGGVGGD